MDRCAEHVQDGLKTCGVRACVAHCFREAAAKHTSNIARMDEVGGAAAPRSEADLRAARRRRFAQAPMQHDEDTKFDAPSRQEQAQALPKHDREIWRPQSAALSSLSHLPDDKSAGPVKRRRGLPLSVSSRQHHEVGTATGGKAEAGQLLAGAAKQAGKEASVDLTSDSPDKGELLHRGNTRVLGECVPPAVATSKAAVIIDDDDDEGEERNNLYVQNSTSSNRVAWRTNAERDRLRRRSSSVVVIDDSGSSPSAFRSSKQDGARCRRRQDESGGIGKHIEAGGGGAPAVKFAARESVEELFSGHRGAAGLPLQASAAGAHHDKLQISSTVSRPFTCPICFDDVDKGGWVTVLQLAGIRRLDVLDRQSASWAFCCMPLRKSIARQVTESARQHARQVAIFSCGHRLCFTCCSHFVGDKVSGAQVSRKQLTCPIPDCKTALTAQEVRGCLADEQELLAKYSSFTLQVFLHCLRVQCLRELTCKRSATNQNQRASSPHADVC